MQQTRSKWQVWPDQEYHFFATLSGTIIWSCPYCGYVQRKRVKCRTWRLQCTNNECRRSLEFGLQVKRVKCGHERNRLVIPRDMLAELSPRLVTMPLGYGPHAPVHELVLDTLGCEYDSEGVMEEEATLP